MRVWRNGAANNTNHNCHFSFHEARMLPKSINTAQEIGRFGLLLHGDSMAEETADFRLRAPA